VTREADEAQDEGEAGEIARPVLTVITGADVPN